MQETRYFNNEGELERHQEIFTAATDKDLIKRMDKRLDELHKKGHMLGKRQEYNAKGKPKKRKVKDRKLKRVMKHAF